MRFTRYAMPAMLTGAMLLAPAGAPAANKDMQELQRDVAQAQMEIRDMRKETAATLATMQASIQQALDASNRANSGIGSLNTGVMQAVQNGMKSLNDQLSSMSGLSVKIGNISEDLAAVEGSVKDLQMAVNKQTQTLTDLSNQIKLMQAPPPAPPPADGDNPVAGAGAVPATGGASAAPQPSAQTLFEAAMNDRETKPDLAMTELNKFLQLYPDDPNAIRAQYNIGDILYSKDPAAAVTAFDAVIERYPKDPLTTPSAMYMKGMALKKLRRNTEAAASFHDVVSDFPHTDEAEQATQQLHSMGIATKSTKKKSSR